MVGILSIQLAIAFGLGHQAGAGLAPAIRPSITNLLGVVAGDPFDEAKETLERLSEHSKEGEQDEEKGEDVVAFTLRGTPYKMVVLHGADEKVSWISAFVRDPEGIPFEQLGDSAKGKITPSLATWEIRSGTRAYRVLAQGSNGRARVVTLLCPRVSHR